MPVTFPAHSAAVLPLKMRWPHRYDGVALVIGSTAPDQAYAVYGWLHVPATHSWAGLLWFVLPLALLETWLCRRAAPIVAAHLGAVPWLRAFAPGDYGAVGARRHRWYVTVPSVIIGGITHLVWDGLAHPPGAPGWANNLMPFLNQPSIRGWWWWSHGQVISSIVGSLIAIELFRRIGRRRLVLAWDGPAPDVPLRPGLFWSIAITALALEVASWPIQNYKTTYPVQGVRALWAIGLGLLIATAAVSWRNRVTPSGSARRTLPADPPPPRTSRPESPSAVR
jgi:hypothetical protein